eukprot:GHVU01032217.1.p2 GENE.GHVU01032217.1~~GHVU01032217.1.p2  ORF type:complete len:103 (+),score=13.56 GHVU01032217.1:531-839(+)
MTRSLAAGCVNVFCRRSMVRRRVQAGQAAVEIGRKAALLQMRFSWRGWWRCHVSQQRTAKAAALALAVVAKGERRAAVWIWCEEARCLSQVRVSGGRGGGGG